MIAAAVPQGGPLDPFTSFLSTADALPPGAAHEAKKSRSPEMEPFGNYCGWRRSISVWLRPGIGSATTIAWRQRLFPDFERGSMAKNAILLG